MSLVAAPLTVLRTITYTSNVLHRLTAATYSTGKSYAYAGCSGGGDDVGPRVALTGTTGTTHSSTPPTWLPDSWNLCRPRVSTKNAKRDIRAQQLTSAA